MSDSKRDREYSDILDLPYHGSRTHPRMPMIERAAQFSPFAALTGYGAAVTEAARLTDEWIEPDEDRVSVLNSKLQMISEHIKEGAEASFVYFCPDDKKAGGSYVSASGIVKKIDLYAGTVVLTDGTIIPIEKMIEIESDLFGGTDLA